MEQRLQVPQRLTPQARACLETLAAGGFGSSLSIGGAVGLSYYYEYRPTADVDAWWDDLAGSEERSRVIQAVVRALERFGEVRTRSWGDVTSVESLQEGAVVFSFQVARRWALLRQPVEAPWPAGLRVDSFEDLAASKMEALVARGAPRDFRDVHTLCARLAASPEDLWVLWQKRRLAAGEPAERFQAALAVLTHLQRIQRARPLERIEDPEARASALRLRTWVKESFLHGLV